MLYFVYPGVGISKPPLSRPMFRWDASVARSGMYFLPSTYVDVWMGIWPFFLYINASGKASIIFFTSSKAGSSLREQSEELNSEIIKLRDEITKSLQDKGKKLEDERTLLSPDVFQERADELRKEAEEKQNELNVRLQKIQQAIQRASNSIDSVISPILTEIVNEKGAKMLLERQSLLFADPKLDVSAEVIKKLNKRLPKIDVIVDQD